MRTSLRTALVAVSGILYASTASATAWTPPANVRIVQKDTTSTRVNTSIQQAINGILDAGPGNRYLVKIMPGTYDVGSAGLVMKPYVDVEGSGPETTVIKGANRAVQSDCDGAVVVMKDDMVLRQVSVVNEIQDPASPSGVSHANAVAFRRVSGRAEFVHAISRFPANGLVTNWSRRIGFCVEGQTKDPNDPASVDEPARAELVHVYAEGNNRGGQGNGIRVAGNAHVNVTDSRLVGISDTDSAYPINSTGEIGEGSITVNDCSLESTAGSSGSACPLWGGDHALAVSNSRLFLSSAGAYSAGVYSQYSLNLTNSTITATDSAGNPIAINYDVGGRVRIANTQLPGPREQLVDVGAKLVGCYDEDFNAIPATSTLAAP